MGQPTLYNQTLGRLVQQNSSYRISVHNEFFISATFSEAFPRTIFVGVVATLVNPMIKNVTHKMAI